GYDSLDWFKDRVKIPEAVIDLSHIGELHGIREVDGAVEIGAMTTLTEVSRSPLVRGRFQLLADAASEVASPQIRNAGTLGGNLCQDTRCWYYRYGVDCYRAGGNTCYAAAPDAQNREHAIFGASRCVAVSPSDTAPALVALDASMVVRSVSGERVVPADNFFMEPGVDIERMTVLEAGEILTSVRIPPTWADAAFYFEKVSDRNSWDFALASIAAAFRTDGVTIDDARVVCGAVQCIPRRLRSVERYVSGRPRTPEGVDAAGAMAVKGAEPLSYNGYKIPLVTNLVKRALRSL
ncbi:MAG: xanthine dehydrogenase family protein subunit M, partial [Gemmatimonadetes bacterium]|nr:xanthine dehydrogenase family protein subunit M [Gemmatimonadota bacterium]